MNDAPGPLSPLQVADLDRGTLSELLTDIEALGEDVEVLVKRRAGQVEARGETSLTSALELLLEGQAEGVQLRYRYRGTDWWDTLMRTPKGIRLVRIQHGEQPSKEIR